MPSKRCCCPAIGCPIASDNFNRADGDPGAGWFGDGEILSNVLASDEDRTTVCHPVDAPLGAFWSASLLVTPAEGSEYVIQVGNPADDYRVRVTFDGVVGSGTFTIQVEDGVDVESWEYVWENEEEVIFVCWQPDIQISAGPTGRTSEAPGWVTLCVDTAGDTCWTV